MNDLKVSLVQTDLVWENTEANLEHFGHLIGKIKKSDLILLPEMFTTGFTMNVHHLAEEMDGRTVRWMLEKASNTGAVISGSIIIREKGDFFNRLLWVTPAGDVKKYDKRHLFSIGSEHLYYTPGKDKMIVEWKGWKICPLICYDLRFPVWIRNKENYDLLVIVANWPSPRHHVWRNQLTARAIENQAFCVGVNRIGSDGMGLKYFGDSAVIDPKGFATFLGDTQKTETFTISHDDLHDFRKKFPILNDMDRFRID